MDFTKKLVEKFTGMIGMCGWFTQCNSSIKEYLNNHWGSHWDIDNYREWRDTGGATAKFLLTVNGMTFPVRAKVNLDGEMTTFEQTL